MTSSKTPRKAAGDERAGAALDEARVAGVKASDQDGQTQGRRDLEETKYMRSSASTTQRATSSSSSASAVKQEQYDSSDSEKEHEGDGGNEMEDEIRRLRKQVERMEILLKLKELERGVTLKKSTKAAQAATPSGVVSVPTDQQHRGYYGLREDAIVENLIQSEFNKHKTWTHPESGREENQSEREARMIFYDMLVHSLQNFRTMFTSELVGDNYAIVRNVMKYGAPNSMKMKIELTKRLGNYVKETEQGYQEYEYGLRSLVDELAAVGQILSVEEITLRLLAGMTNDKRYNKECKELSDDSATYATVHLVFTQRAQAVGNLTSSRRAKEEINAATTNRRGGGKEKQNHCRDSDGDHDDEDKKRKYEKADASRSTATRPWVSPCTYFLIYGVCRNEECDYDHFSPDDIKKWRVKHDVDNPDGTPKKKKVGPRRDRAKSGRHEREKSKKAKRKESESDDYSDQETKTGSSAEDTVDGMTSESEDSSVRRKRNKKKKKDKKKKVEPCFVFQNTGTCPRGRRCRHAHVKETSDDDSAELSHLFVAFKDDNTTSPGGSSRSSSGSERSEPQFQSDTSEDGSMTSEPESILSDTVIGDRAAKRSKRTPIKGGRASVPSLKTKSKKGGEGRTFSQTNREKQANPKGGEGRTFSQTRKTTKEKHC